MKPNMTLVGRLLQLTLWTCCWFRRQIFILVLLCLVLCHFLNVYPWTATERLMTLMKFVSRWTFSGFVWIGSIADSYIICNKYTYMIYVVSHFESNKICNQNWFVECVGDVNIPPDPWEPGIFAYMNSDIFLKTRSICRYKCTVLLDSIDILGGGFNLFIIFTPILGEMILNLTSMCLIHGWKRHRLQKCLGVVYGLYLFSEDFWNPETIN